MTAAVRMTVPRLAAWKEAGRKIPMLTCYDFTMARILDACRIPVLLVGDSLGQVVLGYDSTLPVTLDEMIHHTRAVTRARPWGLVFADLPFMTYQPSVAHALEAAGELVRAGRADGVKLEGGARSVAAIEALVAAGIPVMGHLGLTPQSVLALGGYGVRGREAVEAETIRRDAAALEAAGCCSLVLESVPALLAAEITAQLRIPTIGIGAGPGCDGQVLVLHDMLGLFGEFRPRFVRRFLEGADLITGAVEEYVRTVQEGTFPAAEHSYGPGGKTPACDPKRTTPRGAGSPEAGGE
ncbi:MAG: 3-methyl-2-oxobutanoate hydroxymethyltransferase [Candidatus Eisenbacteria sp.]|nr:3-methyl-2-oxobutanoate hydroxymethyltransferase [Candidatus Eisenbacteria bacterium]